MRTALRMAALAVGMAGMLAAPAAFAQDTPPPATGGTGTGTAQAGGTAGASADVNVAPPTPPRVAAPAAPPRAEKEDDGVTDHEKVIGRFAVGYMGLTNIPLGGGGQALGVQKATVPAPVIGVRYWINPKVGLDLGVGVALASSSLVVENANQSTTTDGPGIFGGALHGGIPIALATAKHYTFQVVPEVNLGFASRTDRFSGNTPPSDLSHSGLRIDAGARAGAEIHFGFIGVPELALQATVGLYLSHQRWSNKQEQGPNGPASLQSSSISETGLSTTVQSDPWALFTNNISALYYF